jgi:hypothetical protein
MPNGAGVYRGIRANMEQTWVCIGLDHYGRGLPGETAHIVGKGICTRHDATCWLRSGYGRAVDTLRNSCSGAAGPMALIAPPASRVCELRASGRSPAHNRVRASDAAGPAIGQGRRRPGRRCPLRLMEARSLHKTIRPAGAGARERVRHRCRPLRGRLPGVGLAGPGLCAGVDGVLGRAQGRGVGQVEVADRVDGHAVAPVPLQVCTAGAASPVRFGRVTWQRRTVYVAAG